MDARRPAFIRRWWLALALGAVALVLLGAKLSLRSLATGEAVIPGVAGAPVIGPASTPTATPGPLRTRLRVQVLDQAGQPVPQAMVEVRDRFSAMAGQQETGPTGEAIVGLKPDSGYIVTARKPGLAPGRIEGLEIAPPAMGPPGPPAQAPAGTPAAGAPFRGQVVQVRLGPGGPGPSTAGARLYVGHSTPRVSLIDASSNLLLKHSESLGQGRVTLLAVARDQSKVFVAWFSAPELLVLNSEDLSVERQVSLGPGGITSLAVNPQNGRLWVATLTADTPDSGLLHELDPAAQEVLRRIPLAQTASNIRFRPDGSILYLPHRAGGTLGFLDPVSGTVLRSARMGQWPTDLAVSSDGRHLYMVNLGSTRLLEVDATTGEETRSMEVGTGSSAVAVHPDGKRLFIVNQSLGLVQALDLDAGQVLDIVPVGRGPQGATLTPDATGLYVANAGSASISLVDLDKNSVRETLAMAGAPASLLLVR